VLSAGAEQRARISDKSITELQSARRIGTYQFLQSRTPVDQRPVA
jgi:hypothetical protein